MRKPRRITSEELSIAKGQCMARKALPGDWDDWFPSVVFFELKIDSINLMAADLERFAVLRLTHKDDPHRHIESAQCLMLLHFLKIDSDDTVVATRIG